MWFDEASAYLMWSASLVIGRGKWQTIYHRYRKIFTKQERKCWFSLKKASSPHYHHHHHHHNPIISHSFNFENHKLLNGAYCLPENCGFCVGKWLPKVETKSRTNFD
ncbi:uncharacterized protein LOC118763804 [Octopus sinensis]|uniref:Uncharacterized protein LOC118763804 n=1 Tax=Octopus sinensis TaxID=2607531 RepID=A0A7E6EVX3_9MOLL|nr:uncharacterized protein LOC118763804 [Octopus sinensis]